MAQTVTGAPEGDLDGGPADETAWFGLDRTGYETDLSAKNARPFRTILALSVAHAGRWSSCGCS
jgi:hypothetical protein